MGVVAHGYRTWHGQLHGDLAPTDMWLEGVAQVHEEGWGALGSVGSYRRLIVACPYHGASCQKKRNYDTKDSVETGLGDDEPGVFLGSWLNCHADFGCASDHDKFKPARSQVVGYARRLGWR